MLVPCVLAWIYDTIQWPTFRSSRSLPIGGASAVDCGVKGQPQSLSCWSRSLHLSLRLSTGRGEVEGAWSERQRLGLLFDATIDTEPRQPPWSMVASKSRPSHIHWTALQFIIIVHVYAYTCTYMHTYTSTYYIHAWYTHNVDVNILLVPRWDSQSNVKY